MKKLPAGQRPPFPLIRLQAFCRWVGCDERDVTKWVEAGLIKKRMFAPNQRAFYSRSEIERNILNQTPNGKEDSP